MVHHIWLVLPVVLPLLGALVCLPGEARWQQRVASLVGFFTVLTSVALFVVVRTSGIVAVAVANWPAPFGIVLVADLLSALLLLVTSFLTWLTLVYSRHGVPAEQPRLGYFALVLLLEAGVHGALLTGDLFNLYVWFEVLLMASFVVLTLGGTRGQLEGGLKYVTLNLLASAFFLSGVGLLYGQAGSLNLAHLFLQSRDYSATLPWLTGLALLFLAFGVKAAVFPLFGWLPASYHTPPVAITALFSALLTKVGVYAMVRVGTLLLPEPPSWFSAVVLAIAAATMITGVLGAVAQSEMKRLLSFHIVSQIGYLVMGFGLGSVAGLAGTIFFFVHVIVAKAALFFATGVVERRLGSTHLLAVGGHYARDPMLATAAFVAAMALAGLPPFSGFVAKLQLVSAGLSAEAYATVAAAVAVSLLTLFSMSKIWAEAFWKDPPAGYVPERWEQPMPACMRAPVFVLAGMNVLLGLFAAPLLGLAHESAMQLLDPDPYVRAVLPRR